MLHVLFQIIKLTTKRDISENLFSQPRLKKANRGIPPQSGPPTWRTVNFRSRVRTHSIENEAKSDRNALLTMRWTNSLDTVLESDVCQSVYAGLPGNYSTRRIIRAVTGIIHSLVYDFAQTKSFSFSQPVDTSFSVTPEDDVALYRISGAALCQKRHTIR